MHILRHSGGCEVLEVAHISPYSSDKKNRANPANGIALCALCHKAYDNQVLRIAPDAHVEVQGSMANDSISQLHVLGLDRTDRTQLLRGLDQVVGTSIPACWCRLSRWSGLKVLRHMGFFPHQESATVSWRELMAERDWRYRVGGPQNTASADVPS